MAGSTPPPIAGLTPGQRLGKYRIVRHLAAGGMGVVFEALHEELQQRVAIKVLSTQLSTDEHTVSRFLNEARALSMVRHPGVVSVLERDRLPDGTVYMVMEYLEGDPLHRRLRKAEGLPVAQVLRYGRLSASALAAVHERGMVHRDLKPHNIMVIPDPDMPGGERLKIFDFGIAKLTPSAVSGEEAMRTKTGAILGTPAYMSPEQCRGAEQVSAQSDVYSLGVILYEMLRGELPFFAATPFELMAKQIFSPLPLLPPEVPSQVAELVHAMLRKEPEGRPSMAEVARRISRLEEDPLGLRPPASQSSSLSAAPAELQPRRRDGGRAFALGGGALLLLALLGLGAYRGLPPRHGAAAPADLRAPPDLAAPPDLRAPPDLLPPADLARPDLAAAPADARRGPRRAPRTEAPSEPPSGWKDDDIPIPPP